MVGGEEREYFKTKKLQMISNSVLILVVVMVVLFFYSLRVFHVSVS